MTKRSGKDQSKDNKKRTPKLKKEVIKDLDAKHSSVKGGGGKPQTQVCTPPQLGN